MKKLEYYRIEIRPFMYESDMYEVTAHIDGEKYSVTRMVSHQMPHEAELEVVHRLGTDIMRNLRDRENHKECCGCCEKKCPKY